VCAWNGLPVGREVVHASSNIGSIFSHVVFHWNLCSFVASFLGNVIPVLSVQFRTHLALETHIVHV